MLLSPQNNKYSPEYFNDASNYFLEEYKAMIKDMSGEKTDFILRFMSFLEDIHIDDEKLSKTVEQVKHKIIEFNKENDEKQVKQLTELTEMYGEYLKKTYVPQLIRIWKKNPENGLLYEEYE